MTFFYHIHPPGLDFNIVIPPPHPPHPLMFTMHHPALKNLKYKVKLTPGTIKKGKACKNAVEVFVKSKNYTALPPPSPSPGGAAASSASVDAAATCQLDATNKERALIKGLTDPEMVAIMIGDVKLSMPGLYSTLKKKKEASKKGKKK